jgi:hypothetical protein
MVEASAWQHIQRGVTMTTEKPEQKSVRIKLTEQQKETLRELGLAPEGYDDVFADLKVEELEERICPAMMTN